MKDHAHNDFRDRSAGAVIARCIAHVRARITQRERADSRLRFHVRHSDGFDFITPMPSGAALPMARRRKGK